MPVKPALHRKGMGDINDIDHFDLGIENIEIFSGVRPNAVFVLGVKKRFAFFHSLFHCIKIFVHEIFSVYNPFLDRADVWDGAYWTALGNEASGR